jgi:hypothetical protein
VNKHSFIFIGGLHRSGTSLVFKCLKDHPDISGFANTGVTEDEGQLLQSVYSPAGMYGGPGRFGFKAASYLDETSELVSVENANQLFQEWSKYWDLGKRFLSEKSPPNIVRSRFLQALFPDSYFIMISRHPIAVSYATRKWSKTSIQSLIAHWLACHERFSMDKDHLKRWHVLKYEDFVSSPQAALNTISDFLGLRKVSVTRVVHSDVNKKYFELWKDCRKGKFTNYYANYIIRKYESRVNLFGYSLKI